MTIITYFTAATLLIWGAILAVWASKNLKNLFTTFLIIYIVRSFMEHSPQPIIYLVGYGFTIWDFYDVFLWGIIFIRYQEGHYKGFFASPFNKVLLIYFLCECIIICASAMTYGGKSLAGTKTSFHFFPFLFVILSYKYNNESLKDFYTLLLKISLVIIAIYIGTICGLLKLYTQATLYSDQHTYLSLRYLSNRQVLMLLCFFVLTIKQKQILKSPVAVNLLSIIVLFLIVTSTQRTLTLILTLYLCYELWKRPGRFLFTCLAVCGVTFIVLPFAKDILHFKLLESAFTNIIYDFWNTNAGMRILDNIFVIKKMWHEGNLLFGQLSDASFLAERVVAERILTFSVHNYFVGTFIFGGLLLSLPQLALWLSILIYLGGSVIARSASIEEELAFWWMLIYFLFNNTSGTGITTGLVLGYSMMIINDRLYIKLSTLESHQRISTPAESTT